MALTLDPQTYFSERELCFKPKHFTIAKTPITTESKNWIYDKLKGRFCLVEIELIIASSQENLGYDFDSLMDMYPAFEDPAEATFYELTWS